MKTFDNVKEAVAFINATSIYQYIPNTLKNKCNENWGSSFKSQMCGFIWSYENDSPGAYYGLVENDSSIIEANLLKGNKVVIICFNFSIH